MKKSILLFVIAATTIVAGLVSCGTDGPSCSANGFSGQFNGTHRVFLGVADLAALGLVDPIADVIQGTVSGSDVTISSDLLPIDLEGTISASNSNVVNLDSLILNTGDTIRIPSATVPGGTLKIWDLRAGGTGTLDCNTVNTSLKVKKGRTNYDLEVLGKNLNNLEGLTLELRGSFTRP